MPFWDPLTRRHRICPLLLTDSAGQVGSATRTSLCKWVSDYRDAIPHSEASFYKGEGRSLGNKFPRIAGTRGPQPAIWTAIGPLSQVALPAGYGRLW